MQPITAYRMWGALRGSECAPQPPQPAQVVMAMARARLKAR